MNFNDLMAKMRELDQPAVESTPVLDDAAIAECPPDMPPSSMSSTMSKPDTPPPSMSLNLNAQGMDNIEQLMRLVKAVNPDTDKPAMPTGGMPPSISIEPMDKPMGGLPPLKMLPDLSDEPHMEPDGDEGPEPMNPDLDKDGDSEKEKKDKEEAFGNSLGDSEPETMGINAAIPDGDDLNKPKASYSDKPFRGDNPMAAESTDLRSQIRAELLRRLEEAKGVK
jgi:hypothetical protein